MTETQIIKTIRGLRGMRHLSGASAIDIAEAETQLGLNFAKEYKEYLSEFGVMSAVGNDFTGIDDEENVVTVTKDGWELNPQVPRNFYVVENARIDGILIWQNSDGAIYMSAPNCNIKKIADSFSDYLKSKQTFV